MIVEHRLVVDRIAQALDLLGHVRLIVVQLVCSLRNLVMSEIGILDWAWVAVAVIILPASFVGLENLIGSVVKLNFL